MTEPQLIPSLALEVSGEPEPALERLPASPTLITEQEVVFSTAAALGARPRTGRWWIRAIRLIAAAPRRMVLTSTPDSRAPRNYSRRYNFLEDARMAREIHRL
jgi:hypothetical protein